YGQPSPAYPSFSSINCTPLRKYTTLSTGSRVSLRHIGSASAIRSKYIPHHLTTGSTTKSLLFSYRKWNTLHFRERLKSRLVLTYCGVSSKSLLTQASRIFHFLV